MPASNVRGSSVALLLSQAFVRTMKFSGFLNITLFVLVFGFVFSVVKGFTGAQEALLITLFLCVGALFIYRFSTIVEGLNHRTRFTGMKQNGMIDINAPNTNTAQLNFKDYKLDGMVDGTINIWRTDGWNSGLNY